MGLYEEFGQKELPPVKELAKCLHKSKKLIKRRRIGGVAYVCSVVLFLYLYSVNTSRQTSHAWTSSKPNQVFHMTVIAGMFLTLLGAVYSYAILASGVVGEWLDLSTVDKQRQEENELIDDLIGVSPPACVELSERLEIELSAYDSRSDTMKLVVAIFSGLLIGSLSTAKINGPALAIWVGLILSALFFANTMVVLNRQTLRRLSWVLLRVSKSYD